MKSAPPDHWYGFFVAGAIFLIQMGVYGTLNSFPVFLSKMSNDPRMGRPSSTALSFGNSVAVGFSPLLGIVVGGLVDRVGPRVMILLSAAFMATASVLSSFAANSPLTLVLTYSIPSALASSLMTNPGIVAVGSWFERRRALAMGIAYAGGGAGSCILPVIAGALLGATGDWRVSFRYLSLFMLLPAATSVLVRLRAPIDADGGEGHDTDAANGDPTPGASPTSPSPPLLPADEYGVIEAHEAHDVHRRRLELLPLGAVGRSLLSIDFLALFTVSTLFGFSFYGLLFVAIPFGKAIGAEGTAFAPFEPLGDERATTLMVYYGVFQIVGSVIIGAFASRINERHAYVLCCGAAAVSFGFFSVCRTYATMAAAVSVIGLTQAGALAVLPALVVHHFEGPNAGTFVGLNFCSFAVGGFAGAPLCTAIADAQNGDYTVAIALLGFAIGFSGLLALTLVPHERLAAHVPLRSPQSTQQKREEVVGSGSMAAF